MYCKAISSRAYGKLRSHPPLGHRWKERGNVPVFSHAQYHDVRPFPLEEICKCFFVFLLPFFKRQICRVFELHRGKCGICQQCLLYEFCIALVLLQRNIALIHEEEPYVLPVDFLALPQCLVDRSGRGAAEETKNTVASFKHRCVHESFEESDACGGKLPVGIGGKVCEVHGQNQCIPSLSTHLPASFGPSVPAVYV